MNFKAYINLLTKRDIESSKLWDDFIIYLNFLSLMMSTKELPWLINRNENFSDGYFGHRIDLRREGYASWYLRIRIGEEKIVLFLCVSEDGNKAA